MLVLKQAFLNDFIVEFFCNFFLTMSNKTQRRNKVYEKTIELANAHSSLLLFLKSRVTNALINGIKEAEPSLKLLFGKGSTIRKALSTLPAYKQVAEKLKGDLVIAFTDRPLPEVKHSIESFTYPSFAKEGTFAQKDVFIPKGPTGMAVDKTMFFQALDIPTKIANSQIEVTNNFKILSQGKKISAAEATLLSLLNIMPFNYGAKVTLAKKNRESSFFDAAFLDVTEEDVKQSVTDALAEVRALSKSVGLVNELTIKEDLAQAIRESIAVSVATGEIIPEAEKVMALNN